MLLVALTLGFLSSLHCLGMCGGFVLALAGGGAVRQPWRLAAYHLGRLFTYSFLGALAGALGSNLTGLASGQSLLSVLVGLVLVFLGLDLLGFRRLSPRLMAPLRMAYRGLAGFVAGAGARAPFLGGMVNGLLPCGAVLAALALAVDRGGALGGLVTMLSFGAGTVPALTLLAVGSNRLSPGLRARGLWVAGLLMVGFGVVTVLRSGWVVVLHECCATAP